MDLDCSLFKIFQLYKFNDITLVLQGNLICMCVDSEYRKKEKQEGCVSVCASYQE